MFPRSVATHGLLNSPKATASIRGRLVLAAGGLTYFDLIGEAREMLGDVAGDCPVRYPDSMLISILNRGLFELSRIRPDAYYLLYDDNDLSVPEITDSDTPLLDQTNWLDVFGLEFTFYSPLLHWIVGVADISEDPYVEDQTAITQLQLFESIVLTV